MATQELKTSVTTDLPTTRPEMVIRVEIAYRRSAGYVLSVGPVEVGAEWEAIKLEAMVGRRLGLGPQAPVQPGGVANWARLLVPSHPMVAGLVWRVAGLAGLTLADPGQVPLAPPGSVRIAPTGAVSHVSPADPAAGFTLDELYKLVDCELVEAVGLPDGRTMWLDEDGKAKGKMVNPKATWLLMAAGGAPADRVVGTVLVTAEVR